MKKLGNYSKIVDHLFWISFLVFTNPGGILFALGEDSGDGGINVTDLIMIVLMACYVAIKKNSEENNDQSFIGLRNALIIFCIYYLVVFGFFVPTLKNNLNYSLVKSFVKMRHGVINIVLFIMVYEFYLRSYKLFLKYFISLSIFVIILFLVTNMMGLDILPVKVMDRSFVDTQRLLMVNYGLMPLLITMGAVGMTFKFRIKYQKLIYIGFILMFICWLLSIIRRNIFGTFIIIALSLMFYNYLRHKSIISLSRVIGLMVYALLIVGIIQLTFPKYLEAGIVAGQETLYVIQHGETSAGKKDARMGLGKDFMQELIIENTMFGTGFDNRWRTSEGDKAGFEASDYPFLAAIAMSGIFGLVFFIPIYYILIKTMILDVKYLRNHQFDANSLETFMLILFLVYYLYDLLQYMNWFLPLSLFSHSGHKSWYVFLAMYLGARKVFYTKEINNVLIK
ncbi:hypothetical protein [Lutimonas vermicola]|uniref:O-antigen ligase domain-containing protein n=1 Tax=Lutimonas vermicola TaxID=414288 RepID=A0ABU9L1L3_9FLAO